MSEKLYALLLKLYPDHFRRAYSDEALRLVRDRAQDQKGFISGLRLWLDLLADLALSLPREYRRAPRAPMAAQPLNGEPSFQLLVGGSLHPTLLCLAGALSAMLLWMCVSVVGHTKIFPPSFVDSNSLQEIVESALAQVSAAPTSHRSVSGSKKRPAFDVISIKRHAAEGGPVQLGPTPGGFRSIGLPMFG